MNKKSSLGNALASIKRTDPPASEPAMTPPAAAPEPVKDEGPPIGVLFRMSPRDHKVVSDYADDLGMSVQELIETAINKMREASGLAGIQGRPRSKTRRRR